MTQEMDDLKREVQETSDKVDALIASAQQTSADLAAVRQQLADAIANSDPAAIEKAAQDLDAIQAKIDASLPAAPPPTS